MAIGDLIPYAGFGPVPAGRLPCDGQDYAAADYPELASVLAVTSGAGWNGFRGQADPGPGRFRVPKLNGLVLASAGPAADHPTTTGRSVAFANGEEAHQLISPELPNDTLPLGNVGAGPLCNVNTPGDYAVPQVSPGDGQFSVQQAYARSRGLNGKHNNVQPTAYVQMTIVAV